MDASNVTAQTAAAQLFQAMGAASSDFVDPETLPLQILIQDGQEQNGVDDKQVKDEDDEKLLRDIWELEHEKKLWRDYARQMEKERDNLFHFGPVLHLKSPLTRWSEKMYRPDRWDTYWQKYKTSCPCCRRPLDLEITMSSSVDEQPWTPHHPRGSGHAFVTALWGANAGYALGALALGIRLRELSPHIKRVIIHTDDVPSNYLDAFKKDNLWQLRKVDYIDGVSDLYVSKGNVFDGVFTKLAAWTLGWILQGPVVGPRYHPTEAFGPALWIALPCSNGSWTWKRHSWIASGWQSVFCLRRLPQLPMGAIGGNQCRCHFAAAWSLSLSTNA